MDFISLLLEKNGALNPFGLKAPLHHVFRFCCYLLFFEAFFTTFFATAFLTFFFVAIVILLSAPYSVRAICYLRQDENVFS